MLAALVPLLLSSASRPAQTKPDFAVKVIGHGPPVILIPGLMCGSGVWDATVEHLKDRYTCYALTLPGFAGQPPMKAPILSTVRDEIEAYVVDNKLDQPILIGHSLGGTLSLWLASDKPAMFSAVVSVDGVPALGSLLNPNQSPTSQLDAATAIKARYASLDAAHFAAANAATLPLLVTDPKDVEKIAAEANRSDPASVGEAVAEMLQNDLRGEIGKITVPLLVFVPAGTATSDSALEALKARYEAQFHDATEHKLVLVPKARHFVMFDAADFLFSQLDEFLVRIVRRR